VTDVFLDLIGSWGAVALMVVTFLSCLALPVPSSLMMLAAGAFVASGDMALLPAVAGAFAGAVVGDQAGFALGHRLSRWPRLTAHPTRATLLARAGVVMERWGVGAVFLTRWMFSVLGPYVNLVAGSAGMRWSRFTLGSLTGEAVWVGVYVGLGYALSDRITMLADLLASASGLATSALVTAALGWMIWKRH